MSFCHIFSIVFSRFMKFKKRRNKSKASFKWNCEREKVPVAFRQKGSVWNDVFRSENFIENYHNSCGVYEYQWLLLQQQRWRRQKHDSRQPMFIIGTSPHKMFGASRTKFFLVRSQPDDQWNNGNNDFAIAFTLFGIMTTAVAKANRKAQRLNEKRNKSVLCHILDCAKNLFHRIYENISSKHLI